MDQHERQRDIKSELATPQWSVGRALNQILPPELFSEGHQKIRIHPKAHTEAVLIAYGQCIKCFAHLLNY